MPIVGYPERHIDRVNNDIYADYKEAALKIEEDTLERSPTAVSRGISSVGDSLSSCNPDFFLMKLQMAINGVYTNEIEISAKQIEEDLKLNHDLNQKRLEEEKKKSLSVQNASYWNTFQNVATYTGLASSAILGLTCASPLAGVVIAGSAAVGLANRVCSDTGVWKRVASYFKKDENEQEVLSQRIDNTLSIGSALGSLFSLTQAGALLSRGADLLKRGFHVGTTLFTGVANYKSQKAKSQVDSNEAALTRFQKESVALHSEIKQSSQHIDEVAKKDQQIFNKVSSMIHNLIEALKNKRKK